MTPQERRAIVAESKARGHVIHGRCIDLHPCASEHEEAIVRLRNQAKSRYNLNQTEAFTIDGHRAWYEGYVLRDNDIYWCIHDKSGGMIGLIRLNNIEPAGASCNQGSFIVDEAFAMSGPYALETEILTLDYAFFTLRIDRVYNDDRAENKNMNYISRRIGFRFVEAFERNGAMFNLYELTKDAYNRTELERLLSIWKDHR